jgi:hypothetical protein
MILASEDNSQNRHYMIFLSPSIKPCPQEKYRIIIHNLTLTNPTFKGPYSIRWNPGGPETNHFEVRYHDLVPFTRHTQ